MTQRDKDLGAMAIVAASRVVEVISELSSTDRDHVLDMMREHLEIMARPQPHQCAGGDVNFAGRLRLAKTGVDKMRLGALQLHETGTTEFSAIDVRDLLAHYGHSVNNVAARFIEQANQNVLEYVGDKPTKYLSSRKFKLYRVTDHGLAVLRKVAQRLDVLSMGRMQKKEKLADDEL